MKFLNNYPKFREFLTDEYQFYIKGKTNVDYSFILDILRDGKFPNNLKGNFAFYFSDKNRTVIAVDHLPNYQMFYSEDFCGHIFLSLQEEIRKKELPLTVNNLIVDQTYLFWGRSVGEETTKKEIKRIPAGCYLELTPDKNYKIVQYNNIFSHPRKDFNMEELSDIIENFIKKNTQDPFGLLLSSGTDCNTIFGYFRKLGIADRCSFISLKSERESSSEAPYIQKIADYYGINIDWYHVDDWDPKKYVNENDLAHMTACHRTYSGFWFEAHVFLKYHAIRELGHQNKIIFTGEVGDQIFGSSFGKILLKFIIQNPNHDVEEIADLFLNCDLTRFKFISKSKDFSTIFYLPNVVSAYNSVKEWFIETWNKIETDDLVNKIELIQYFYKSSHRVYHYHQFYDLKFAHPFADGYLFDYIWRVPGHYKLNNNGESRALSYDLVKNYMVDWPWKWPKTGPAMLPKSVKFEKSKGKYNEIQLALGKCEY